MGGRFLTPQLPSLVYRVTRACYADLTVVALSGVGGEHMAGRWHEKGRPILYSSQSSSLALLERLVHADEWIADRSPDRVVITLNVPDVSYSGFTAVDLAARDPNWRLEGNALCRRLGEIWLQKEVFCALVVPSAANPLEHNVLFNPRHQEFSDLLNRNGVLQVTPIFLEDRVVSLAQARRQQKAS